MSTAGCGSTPGAAKYPAGLRRSSPSSTRDSATASAFHARISAVGEREFDSGAKQLRPQDVRVGRVDDHPLDRLVQQRTRVVHQIGVQRVVAGDEDDQRALAATASAARLLPEGRDGTGEPGQHHRIQARDVDTQFERVRGGESAQAALRESAFERSAIFCQVAGAVRRDQFLQLWCDVGKARAGTQCGELRAAPRSDEGQRARTLGDQVGHHPRSLSARRTPYRSTVFADEVGPKRWLPQSYRATALRGPVVGHLDDALSEEF